MLFFKHFFLALLSFSFFKFQMIWRIYKHTTIWSELIKIVYPKQTKKKLVINLHGKAYIIAFSFYFNNNYVILVQFTLILFYIFTLFTPLNCNFI